MKSFFKMFLASVLGFFVSIVLVSFFFFFLIAGMVALISKEETVTVSQNTVLHVDLNYVIPERTSKNPFENIDFTFMKPSISLGLDKIIENIQKAKYDDNVKGIYLELGIMPSSFAVLETIRKELEDFKESGKFVVAYGELISQKAYYIGSVADHVFLNPVGFLDMRGFMSQLVFFKKMLEKLEIEILVFDAGQYKSASEPFRLTEMSEANREQLNAFIFEIYSNFLNEISNSRGIGAEDLNKISSNLEARTPYKAYALKLVDGLKYDDEVRDFMKSQMALEDDDKLNLMTLSRYRNAPETVKTKLGNDRIAVLYADGNIVDGDGSRDNIGSARFVKTIRKIREDNRVKALVVRVNSPGGSALASEVILRELELAGEKMPVIVTMGNVAASGGYYIAAKADKIFAQTYTVTGSIGVFGLLPNMEGFFKNKIGLTFDGVQTGKFTDLGNTSRPMTELEKVIIQEAVDSIYMNFKMQVAEGRNFTLDYTESVAQGRIYSGTKALEINLVDTIGGLSDAIAYAAFVADLETYRIVSYPEMQDPFENLLKGLSENIETRFLRNRLGVFYPQYERVNEVLNYHPFQTRMPFDIHIE